MDLERPEERNHPHGCYRQSNHRGDFIMKDGQTPQPGAECDSIENDFSNPERGIEMRIVFSAAVIKTIARKICTMLLVIVAPM